MKSEPDGNIGCPTRCSHDYDAGTKVGLRADPKPGYRFVRWVGGPCAGTATVKTCTVVIDGPRTIRAEFEKIPGPCQCSSLAVQVKSYSDIHARPGDHAARLVLGLQWSMICSGGKGDKCSGAIKISPPRGSDLRLVSPDGDVACTGSCNPKVFTHHIGGARIEFRSTHDFLPGERANKTFKFKIEKFCVQNGKEKSAGTTTLMLAYNSLGELDKKHSNLSLDHPRAPAPIKK